MCALRCPKTGVWGFLVAMATDLSTPPAVNRLRSDSPCVPQVGKAMSSNESAAYEIMTALDVDYVLVIFGGVIGTLGGLCGYYSCNVSTYQ